MTDNPPFPYIPPFVPPRKLIVDYAEFSALRTIVMALVAEVAAQHQISTGGTQTWINALSIRCQESIIAADISVGNDREAGDRIKARVLEQINNILASIIVSSDRDSSD
jgi:hypothetical protein